MWERGGGGAVYINLRSAAAAEPSRARPAINGYQSRCGRRPFAKHGHARGWMNVAEKPLLLDFPEDARRRNRNLRRQRQEEHTRAAGDSVRVCVCVRARASEEGSGGGQGE